MKKIQYSVSMLANPLHENDPKKAYAKLQLTGVVSLRELSTHISEHNSVFSKGTILGILCELSSCIRELLLQGYKIDLDELGTLTPYVKSRGAVSMKDFTSDNITELGELPEGQRPAEPAPRRRVRADHHPRRSARRTRGSEGGRHRCQLDARGGRGGG